MKNLLCVLVLLYTSYNSSGQGLKNVLKKVTTRDSATGMYGKGLGSLGNTSLSNGEIVSGLKEALQVGAEISTKKLSAADGFFSSPVIKILMPAEAKNVETKLRTMGLGKQVDNAILSMNRAAEDASKEALPIFINAIKSMSIEDAVSILRGNESAATSYLRSKTETNLTQAFKPIVDGALAKTGATKYWNTMFTTYNQFSSNKVNPDLVNYVTTKALHGVFYQIAKEEEQIRKDPLARTTETLKKVFAK
jgi:hypothetical protein